MEKKTHKLKKIKDFSLSKLLLNTLDKSIKSFVSFEVKFKAS